jgi:hypothetical protein
MKGRSQGKRTRGIETRPVLMRAGLGSLASRDQRKAVRMEIEDGGSGPGGLAR